MIRLDTHRVETLDPINNAPRVLSKLGGGPNPGGPRGRPLGGGGGWESCLADSTLSTGYDAVDGVRMVVKKSGQSGIGTWGNHLIKHRSLKDVKRPKGGRVKGERSLSKYRIDSHGEKYNLLDGQECAKLRIMIQLQGLP